MDKRVGGRRVLIMLALTLLCTVTLQLLVFTCRLLVGRNIRPVWYDVSCTSIVPWAETIRTRLVQSDAGQPPGAVTLVIIITI